MAQDQLRTRPPLERMMHIHEQLKAGKYPNSRKLAAELQISDRTIKRDLDFMRDRFQLPIEYDSTRYGFYYTKPVDKFPSIAITEAETFALLVAHKAIAQYNGEPAGLDGVSRPGAYSNLHSKLVRSYALEALLEPSPSEPKANGWGQKAEAFLREIAVADETQLPSIGYGTDHRFIGKAVGGAALMYAGELIHAAVFQMPAPATESVGGMASLQ